MQANGVAQRHFDKGVNFLDGFASVQKTQSFEDKLIPICGEYPSCSHKLIIHVEHRRLHVRLAGVDSISRRQAQNVTSLSGPQVASTLILFEINVTGPWSRAKLSTTSERPIYCRTTSAMLETCFYLIKFNLDTGCPILTGLTIRS